MSTGMPVISAMRCRMRADTARPLMTCDTLLLATRISDANAAGEMPFMRSAALIC